MDISNRLIAPSGKILDSNKNIYFDLDGFVKRILLFDHYILDSLGLLELPYLINTFTFNGLIELLESGAISIHTFPVNSASMSPSVMGDFQWPGGIRPPFNYSLATISPSDPLEHVNLLYDNVLPKLDLRGRQSSRLIKAIYSAMAKPQTDPEGLSIHSTINDILKSPKLLARSCSYAAKRQLGKEIPSSEIELEITQLNQFEVKVINNLQTDFDFAQLEAHRIIESAILTIAGEYDRIELMKWYSATTGSNNNDLPLFADKFNFLLSNLSPENKELKFQRVLDVRGIKQIQLEQKTQINIHQLLAIREKPECLAFRQWLTNIDKLTDKEISDLGNSISSTISQFLQSNTGRIFRFLVTNGIGLLPFPGLAQISALGISALDTFVLDHLFKSKPIPLMFIDDMYPSIFKT